VGIETLVKESERLTSVFGYWPSFHDAEIIWLRLHRGDRRAGDGVAGPSMEMEVHTFEITDEVAPTGSYVLKHHVLVHFRFVDIVDLKLERFTQFNDASPHISDIRQDQLENINLAVRLGSSFGVRGEFRCKAAEILAVTPCDAKGKA
jgi:hypothetical protein